MRFGHEYVHDYGRAALCFARHGGQQRPRSTEWCVETNTVDSSQSDVERITCCTVMYMTASTRGQDQDAPQCPDKIDTRTPNPTFTCFSLMCTPFPCIPGIPKLEEGTRTYQQNILGGLFLSRAVQYLSLMFLAYVR